VRVCVGSSRRQKYVELHVDMVLSRSVKYQFDEFRSGFRRGCPSDAWTVFLPEQLMTALKGEEVFNWDDLRQVRRPSLTLQIHQTERERQRDRERERERDRETERENRIYTLTQSYFLQNAQYLGCTPNDEVVQNFWTVFAELSVAQKEDFLSK